MGAQVVVTEIDPTKALEAAMEGYAVMPMREAASRGDIFITVTGNTHVLREEHFLAMKSGALVANSGHFNVEIDIEALERLAEGEKTQPREFVDEYHTRRRPHDLPARRRSSDQPRGCGRASRGGHGHVVCKPGALVPNISCGGAARYKPCVYPVPKEIDAEVARLKLAALGVTIDTLQFRAAAYLASWNEGT